jgi:hypothetical protein
MSTVLVLRTSDKNRRSWGDFEWPESGPVEAPDWSPEASCGGGLHGWLRGEGDSSVADVTSPDRVWQVVEVEEDQIVDLGGKVKFPRGVVIYSGAREGAVALIRAAYPGAAVIYGTATAGEYGTANAGNGGTATAGNGGTANAGNGGTANAGNGGTANAGYGGTAFAGDSGTATAGDYGTATAGVGGTATAGYRGTATAGNGGTATAGEYGTATAGDYGTLILSFWDCEKDRRRFVTGYVGEDGIEAGKAYRLNDDRKFVEVQS